MNIIEIKTINTGSTDYVSEMLKKEFEKDNYVDVIDSIKMIQNNPFLWFSFHSKLRKFDIIHTHLGKASRFTSFIKRKNDIQVSTLHGFQKYKHYKKSDYFTAVSSSVKKYFVDLGIDSNKIKVIPNGIKKEILELPISNKNENFVTLIQVGHLTKNVEFTFNIIKLLKERKLNFKVLFAGEEGNIENLTKRTIDLGISEYVEFLGFVKNINDLYKRADILLSSSPKEGFCLPILEAMAAGVPVVTLDNGGINDYFVNGENGFICLGEYEFFNSLLLLINNYTLRMQISINNKNKAKNYTWEKVAEMYLEYFSEILKTKKESFEKKIKKS